MRLCGKYLLMLLKKGYIMPIKDKIIKELEKGPVKYKKLRSKLKGGKKFYTAVEDLYNAGLIQEKNGRLCLTGTHVNNKKKNASKNDMYTSENNNRNITKNDENELNGSVVKLTENFGFVRVAGIDKDIFVAGRLMMGAIVGDMVNIRLLKGTYREMEGQITAITKEKENVAAVIEKKGGKAFARLKDCQYVVMPILGKSGASDGDMVLINVKNRGTSHRNLKAEVTSVIGKVNSSEQAVKILLAEKEIAEKYPQKAVKEAERVVKNVDLALRAVERENLTGKPIFTIDSASTKDIDDAVCVEKTDNGYILGVHIADVSFYVQSGSECDREALKRGNSVYYGNSVIPMLPTHYSNDMCSLNENCQRLAFSCEINFDNSGNILNYRFFKSVIQSRVKGVYSEVNRILDGTATRSIKEKYSRVYNEIFNAFELYKLLDKKRKSRGSMDIESDEAYIIFDDNGRAIDIEKRLRGTAEMMIEEFMLSANYCSANMAKKVGLPFVYRIHPAPDGEKLENLKTNIAKLGLTFEVKNGESLQQAMSRLLDETRNTNLQPIVHKLVLRSQSKAKYSVQPVGHFGIGLEDYAHFTSPIRRYSDLAIHRIMSAYISGADIKSVSKRYASFAQKAAESASAAELVALQTERGADDIYKAEIMTGHIGEVFQGIVSSVTNFGIYVALDNTVEGLVHVSALEMVSPILEEGYSLSCPVTGIGYRIGDNVKVMVTNTDILNGNIDFAIATDDMCLGSVKSAGTGKKIKKVSYDRKRTSAPKRKTNKTATKHNKSRKQR